MRKLEIKAMGGTPDENYAMLLAQVMKTPTRSPGTGSYEEMRVMVPLVEKLEEYDPAGAGYVLLEESEWDQLCERVKTFSGWNMNRRDILDMCETVLNAPTVAVGEVGSDLKQTG